MIPTHEDHFPGLLPRPATEMGQETILDEEKRVTQTADLREENTGKDFDTGTFLQRLSKEVAPSLGSIPLLACCFATGLTDGTLYNGEYDLTGTASSLTGRG